MKKTIGIIAALVALFVTAACNDSSENLSAIRVSTETLDFPAGKSTRELVISCPEQWRVRTDADWCYVLGTDVLNAPCDGKAFTVGVERNNSLKGRGAVITITGSGGTVQTVRVTQEAAGELAPRLKSFAFREAANPGKLQRDITLDIGDGIVSGRTAFVVEDKELVPEFEFEGGGVYMGEQEIVSGVTRIDFSAPVALTVRNRNGEEAPYTVRLVSFTGLPVVYIDTNGVPVDSKEVYVPATIRIVDNNGRRPSSIFEEAVQVKGRGNSTWGMPKKPYRLKFDKKQSLLGEPKDKSWVLLANYMDDDCGMRNATAYSFGHLSCLDFTPTVHFVELFLNGQHCGLYQLCEHMKISEDRVNVTDDGYLIEAEQRDNEEETGDIYFWAKTAEPKVELRFCIKDPDVEKDSPQYDKIRDYVTDAQNAIYGPDFKDPDKGYARYLNVDTYVDWYVISEITKTNDAALYTSCYMNLAPGGKLNMGPMWDYDICIGNSRWNDRKPEGYWNRHSPWFARMLEDPAFVQRVKARIRYFKANLPAILAQMDENAEYIGASIVEDNRLWHILVPEAGATDNAVREAFRRDVQFMKSWLTKRLDWLDGASFTD